MAAIFKYKRTFSTVSLLTIWIFFFPFLTNVNSGVSSFDDVVHNEVRRLINEELVPWNYLEDRLKEEYKKNSYQTFWVDKGELNSKGYEVINSLKNASLSGLFSKSFPINEIEHLVDDLKVNGDKYAGNRAVLDILISASSIIYLTQVKYGMVKSYDVWNTTEYLSVQEEIMRAFSSLKEGESYVNVVDDFKPEYFQYRKFEEVIHERNLLTKELLYVLSDASGKSALSNQSLLDLFQYIDFCHVGDFDDFFTNEEMNSMKMAYLWSKSFDVNKSLNHQLAWFLLSDYQETIEPLVLNFDRIKQYPVETNDYVWVNIPSCQLELYEGEYPIESFKVIVGSQSTPTPVLSGSLLEVVAYPTWTIPKSITVNEILPAIRNNSGYLKKKGYGIKNWQGEHLNPDSIAWESIGRNNLPFAIVQPSGNYNALGIVKFNFENDQNIYLHDTNARSYFNFDSRALSHGCIRLEKPERLATLILDTVQRSLFKRKIANRSTQHIRVSRDMDVYLRYLTCEVKVDGTLYYYNDIYGKDTKDLQALHKSLPQWN